MNSQTTEEATTDRIQFFSDAVFAIVMTLLVLELHVPHLEDRNSADALWVALRELTPNFLSFSLSFLFVAVFWLAHYQLFQIIQRSTTSLLRCNLLFLFCLTIIPFPTALLGEYPSNPLAVFSFGVMMFLASSSFSLLRWCAMPVDTSKAQA